MFDEEPRGETAATKSFFFISIDPFLLRVLCGNFARSLGSIDSHISRVRSLKAKLARASFERDYNVCSPYFKLQGSPNRILFFAVFSLSGSSTSDVECDNRGWK